MNDAPEEEATLNIVLALPEVPCTLKVTVEEVAFTPATTPSSRKSPVESADDDIQRARKPGVPPDKEALAAPQYVNPAPSVMRDCPTEPALAGSVKVKSAACVEEETICVMKLFDPFAK